MKRSTFSEEQIVYAIRPAELPLGVLTACIGGPLFLWLLRRARHGYVL